MTPFQWVQFAFMVVLSVFIPLFWWTWQSGKTWGTRQTKTDTDIKALLARTDDLTEKITVEVQRVLTDSKQKADQHAMLAMEERLEQRFIYVERRLTEIRADVDKRFDHGSERMSALSGKIIEAVHTFSEQLGAMRIEMARFSERLDERTAPHNRRAGDKPS